eukprot:629303-Prymnesium_polylepis.1
MSTARSAKAARTPEGSSRGAAGAHASSERARATSARQLGRVGTRCARVSTVGAIRASRRLEPRLRVTCEVIGSLVDLLAARGDVGEAQLGGEGAELPTG